MSGFKKIGILGAGGLGRAMARLLAFKKEFKLVAICDTHGIAYCADGLDAAAINSLDKGESVGTLAGVGHRADDPIGEMIALGNKVDGLFMALPNIPNDFIPNTVRRIAQSPWRGVLVDALKRSSAVEQVMAHQDALARGGITYITGAGATPGLLTAAAALASQSFVEVEDVKIWFGVGIDNWDAYRATVREDIAHMPGFDVEKVARMTDAEIEAELDRRNGLLELVNMEHADDVMLERAHVVSRDRVSVGGLVDTRNPKKPVSTNVKVTGKTFEGKRSTHTFTLGDETSMAANVNGPALGFMKTGFWLQERGICGVFTSAELMPKFVD